MVMLVADAVLQQHDRCHEGNPNKFRGIALMWDVHVNDHLPKGILPRLLFTIPRSLNRASRGGTKIFGEETGLLQIAEHGFQASL